MTILYHTHQNKRKMLAESNIEKSTFLVEMDTKVALGAILLAVACSWGALTSAEEEFFLTLVPTSAECENEGGSGSIAMDSAESMSGEDTTTTTITTPWWSTNETAAGSGDGSGSSPTESIVEEEEECEFGSEVKVRCSCGRQLRETRDKYKQMVTRRCERYDELSVPSSPFSFCESSLRDLFVDLQPGYKLCRMSVDALSGSNVDQSLDQPFNDSSLRNRVREIEQQIALFRIILDRTITGVLVDSNSSKCLCLVRT